MTSESPESPYRPPTEVTESSPTTPGLLGITGAFVIAALAGGGACCVSCFGGLFLLDGIVLDGAGALIICGIVGLVTFGVVLSVLTRTVHALESKNKIETDDAIVPQSNRSQEGGMDDTPQ